MLPSAICGRTRDLLRLAAGQPQRGAAQHDRRQIRLQRQHAAERLHHQHDLDRAAAEPAILLGERQAQQAQLGVLRPQRAAPAFGLGEIVLRCSKRVVVGQQPIDAVRSRRCSSVRSKSIRCRSSSSGSSARWRCRCARNRQSTQRGLPGRAAATTNRQSLQPQHGFGQDVLLDLVGAAIDRGGAQEQIAAGRLASPSPARAPARC